MNAVDYVVLGLLAVSGLLAFLRGFVREVLGVAAWIGAAVIALSSGALVRPYVKQYIGQWLTDPVLQDYAGIGAVFLVAVIVLLMISHWVGALVRQSVLGGVDRSLGLVFGLGRGAALIVVAYIGANLLIPIKTWPEFVLQARSLPVAYQGATWLSAQIPAAYRPKVEPPPLGRETNAGDLMRATPAGRASGPAPGAAGYLPSPFAQPPAAPPAGPR